MNDPRIFDLDDVHAICSAFHDSDLAWATLPPRWRARTLKARREEDVPSHAWSSLSMLLQLGGHEGGTVTGLTNDATNAYDGWVAERAGRARSGPLFGALEIAWLRCCDLHRLCDPRYASAKIAELTLFGNALQFRRFLETGEGGAANEPGRREKDQAAARALVQRYLDAEQAALRQVADRAMAQQDDQPVCRPRARL